nr:NAD(P)H-dependent oxidoreductase [Gluconacetobacter tumulicola]
MHIDTSILGDASASRTLSRAVVDQVTGRTPGIDVTYRDLAAYPISHLSGAALAGGNADGKHDQALQEDLALGGRALEEFLSADMVVIGVGFYNFGIPSQLKAWIDRIAVAGKTFRYTDKGPEGLAADKRIILTIARGGFYGPDSGRQSYEHAESYLRALFSFLGVTQLDVIAAEGMKVSAEQRERALSAAYDQIAALAA